MRRSVWGVAVVVAVAVAVLGYVSDLVLLRLAPRLAFAVADAALLGAVTGAVAWLYQRRENAFLLQRLHVIGEMNHHVRNGLQVIQYSAYMTKDREHIQRIEQSVERIDWALREVLPGKELRSDAEGGGAAA